MSEPEKEQRPVGANDEDLARFVLTTPREIGAVLRQLAQRQDFVSIHFAEGKQLMLSRVLSVDMIKCQVVLDVGSNPPINDALALSERNVVVAIPDGVKVEFVLERLQPVQFEGLPAFIVPFPKDLIKLQRREFFRIDTPMGSPWTCDLKLPNKQRISLEINDISLGGIGLVASAAQAALLPSDEYVFDAGLAMGSWGRMAVPLELRSVRVMATRSGQEMHHIGCRFLNLGRAAEMTLQRVVSHLERERRALAG